MSDITNESLKDFLLRRIKSSQESQEHWQKNKAESASTFTFGMQLAFEETLRFIFFPPKQEESDHG